MGRFLMKKSDPGNGRNLGIDLLRIVAMFLIAAVHVYNQGGVAAGLGGKFSLGFQMNYPMRLLCYTAVDLYALISGYVMLQGRFRPGRFLELWLQVVVIGLVECAVWTATSPAGTVTIENWMSAIFPVLRYEYWYFSAYAGMFLLSPLLSRGLRSLSQAQARWMVRALFLVFSVCWIAGKSWDFDCFRLGSGYSALWLVVLFAMGGAMRRAGLFESTKTGTLAIGAVFCILVLWGLRDLLYLDMVPERIRDLGKLILNYCNPLLLLFSMLTLQLFTRLRFGRISGAVVRWMSPLAFGVYLIHVHPFIWGLLENRFQPITELPQPLILPAVLAMAAGIFLSCILLDWVRSLLFKLLQVRRFCNFAEEQLAGCWRE